MSRPSTIVIPQQDDERTLVDPRFSAPPRWRRARAWLVKQRRRVIEAGVGLALVLSLGGVAYQQRRIAATLRETIDALETRSSAPDVGDLAGSPSPEWLPIDRQRNPLASIRAVAPDERSALETRGANLIGSNDFSGALVHYQMLTELFPGEVAFRDVVRVLKAKLKCPSPAGDERAPCS
jgi:hypothetical protein